MPMDLVFVLKWVKSIPGCLLYTFQLSGSDGLRKTQWNRLLLCQVLKHIELENSLSHCVLGNKLCRSK